MDHATTTWVGLDAHKKFIQVAMRRPDEEELVEWRVPYTVKDVQKLARKLTRKAPGEVRCCYEAGPVGFTLQRRLEAAQGKAGLSCAVIAPALIPKKPGERVKTDRRDARKLCDLFRAGLLTDVHPPSEAEESVRDLSRARYAAKQDQHAARHRLSKLLLRRGRLYGAGKAWTSRHRAWLRSLRFDDPVDEVVFANYLLAIEQIEARIETLDTALAEAAASETYAERVGWLRCFRGIDTVTAMTLLAEIHDFQRFESPRQLMSYLGLTPSEHTSADKPKRGGITKAGNNRVRRMLIEASWHYRHRPSVGVKLRKRREGQPERVIAIADKAQQRLSRRYHRLTLGSRKPPTKAVVAVARELVGFIWAALRSEVTA
jgi:transposase